MCKNMYILCIEFKRKRGCLVLGRDRYQKKENKEIKTEPTLGLLGGLLGLYLAWIRPKIKERNN